MLGRHDPCNEEAQNWPHRVPEDSFYGQMGAVSDQLFTDDEFADMLKPLQDKGVHILVEMMQCFSGGFIGNLQGQVEKIVTASSEDNKSYARESDAGYDNVFQLGFVDGLIGIDVDSVPADLL